MNRAFLARQLLLRRERPSVPRDYWPLAPTVRYARRRRNEALVHLVRRYLAGFGPASRADIAAWSGVPAAQLDPALERLPLRRLRDEQGGEILDLQRAPLPDASTSAPVRFLPTWDAVLLVHARRARVLPEEYRPLVFDITNPASVPTFPVDGRVAGTWRHEGGRLRLQPFEPIPRAHRHELDPEARRLRAFLA